MLEVYINKVVERWIAEQMALGEQVVVESLIVVAHHLLHHGQLWIASLQDDKSALALAPGAPTDLTHHRECILVGTKVGKVEHRVSVEDAHHGHAVEVESFANHLCTDEQIGLACAEVVDDTLVGSFRAGGVEIHACHACFGKHLFYLVLDLLRAIAAAAEVRIAATGADHRHRLGVAAIVAGKHVEALVIGEAHVAVLAVGHPAADLALDHRRKATAVLEEDSLLALAQRLAYGTEQLRRERTTHHFAVTQVLDVDDMDVGQLYTLIALHELHISVFSRLGVVVAFHAWRGTA